VNGNGIGREWEKSLDDEYGNGNNCGMQMGAGTRMNERELEGMGITKLIPAHL
jgi:hypothetical protein